MKKIAIIVAGGIGKRMHSSKLKQFMLLKNQPLLMHTINRFYKYDNQIELRLILPAHAIKTWEKLCKEYDFYLDHFVFKGGIKRYDSVKNGLKNIFNPSLVAIHDGVRPLVSKKTISNCFELAEKFGSAVPVLKLTESIRKIVDEGSIAKERELYRTVQTPQVFQSEILLDAYSTTFEESFTDDASVVENRGYKIFLTEGNEENIKITSQRDLLIAEHLLNHFRD